MKNKISFLQTVLFILPFILFFGCNKSTSINNDNTIYGSGKIVSQTRIVEECSGLTIKNVGNVYLSQADTQSIRIEADDNIINKVITQNDNGVLLTGLEDGSYSNITVKIYVSLKNIYSLSIEGAGKINAEKEIQCDTLSCVINGAGSIYLMGNANYFDCIVNGAGNVSAKNFIAKKCRVIVNGAGSMTIYVSDELDASVNGVGNITYYGNPDVVQTSISGSGHITKGG